MVPCGMRPDKPTVVRPEMRRKLLEDAIDCMVGTDIPVFVDSTEVDSGRYIPTREIMNIYRYRYPHVEFKCLIGDDLLPTIHLWDDFPQLVSENDFIVYKRLIGDRCPNDLTSGEFTCADPQRTVVQYRTLRSEEMGIVLSNISSSEVRKRIRSDGYKSIHGLVPLPVYRYIKEHQLYS
jgi:nicotinate (nicotinamide) nucleotide adenylyltransferase